MLTDVCASRHVLIVLFLDRDQCAFLSQSVRVEKKKEKKREKKRRGKKKEEKKKGAFIRIGGLFLVCCVKIPNDSIFHIIMCILYLA